MSEKVPEIKAEPVDVPSLLEQIALDELEITTLETTGDNEQDFHRLACWEIETVMDKAYDAGYLTGQKAANEWSKNLAQIEAGCAGGEA